MSGDACEDYYCVNPFHDHDGHAHVDGVATTAPTGDREPDGAVTEYGVFRKDSGYQVGIGTTEDKMRAQSDRVAWENDGIPVVMKERTCGPWREVPGDD